MSIQQRISKNIKCSLGHNRWFYRLLGKSLYALVILSAVGIGTTSYTVQAEITQDIDQIRHAVRVFILSESAETLTDQQVEIGNIDPRLRLPTCTSDLKLFHSAGSQNYGNTTIGVRCLGTAPWLIYVPVKMTVKRRVVIATRPLSRGTVLMADDLKMAVRNVAPLSAGYLDQIDQAVGRQLKRPILIGSPLSLQVLQNKRVIRRGQRITIFAASGSLQVRMTGKALMDGVSGQSVRVENLRSGRIIEGIVSDSGTVRVRM